MSSFVVIPARLRSSRLPRKLLLRETGKTLIQHTYEAASHAKQPEGLCVAADHEEIAEAVREFGGQVVMTDPAARSGTDRVAEVAAKLKVDIVVNVQGDEPEIEANAIDQLVALLEAHPAAEMATLATPLRQAEQLRDPACVKVVCNRLGEAMYFSRSVIPHPREWSESWLEEGKFLQHVGLYAYRREFLLELTRMPPAPSEIMENLEQLRVLDAGKTILVGQIPSSPAGIDTPADYDAFVRRSRGR